MPCSLSPARNVGLNSSLLLWHTDNTALHTLYTFLQRHYAPLLRVIYKFDHYLEMMLLKHLQRPAGTLGTHQLCFADESLCCSAYLSITDFSGACHAAGPVCCYFQDHCEGRIVDYYAHLSPHNAPSVEAPSILCFPLEPKPHQLLDCGFIRQHWLGEAAVLSSPEAVD